MFSITINVNGKPLKKEIQAHMLLIEFLRDHMGWEDRYICERHSCGACSIIVDGVLMKACTRLAIQHNHSNIFTLDASKPELDNSTENQADHPFVPILQIIRQVFNDGYAFQCHFCMPGIIMTIANLLASDPNPDELKIRHWIEGNLCKCGNYDHIIKLTQEAAQKIKKTIVQNT
ncbi:MAG: 2Fe-2S iron-sulfur cluster-binding protein [Pseudomonadota bacterium]